MMRVARAIACVVQIQRDAWAWDIGAFHENGLGGLRDDRALNKFDALLNSEDYPCISRSSLGAHWEGCCGILFGGMFCAVCKSILCPHGEGCEQGALGHSDQMEVRSTTDSRKICSGFSGLSKKFQTHGMVFLFSALSLWDLNFTKAFSALVFLNKLARLTWSRIHCWGLKCCWKNQTDGHEKYFRFHLGYGGWCKEWACWGKNAFSDKS